MSSVEFIGKLMAGAVNAQSVRSTAGVLLSKSELAGLLSGLSSPEMMLALAKYGCDTDSEFKLQKHVRAYVTTLALKNNWKPRNRDLLAGLAVLAVNEVMSENLCPSCHGVGLISGIHICNVCNGTKYKALSGRAMADIVGVSEKQWRDVWKERYDLVFEYVCGLNSNVHRKIGR